MFTRPENNLRAFNIQDHMLVADLGAGTGFYTVLAGELVSRGKVYAIEIQKDFLETIRGKVRAAGLRNVECILGNVEEIGGTKLADNLIDRAIASNIFFQVEDKDNFVKEIKRILKPGGKILLVDHCPDRSSLRLNALWPKEKAKEIFLQNGFAFEQEIDAGPQHYGIILTKQG